MLSGRAVLCCAGVGVVRVVAAMISPYMPSLTSRIMAQLNMPEDAAQLTDDLIKAAATPQVCACLRTKSAATCVDIEVFCVYLIEMVCGTVYVSSVATSFSRCGLLLGSRTNKNIVGTAVWLFVKGCFIPWASRGS